MGNLTGVDIQRGTIGANAIDNNDAISGILLNGPAIVAAGSVLGLAVDTPVVITTVREAEAYGITAAYDSTNKTRAYRHITEFFRMAGEGTPLWIGLYEGTPAEALSITATAGVYKLARKMVQEAAGTIRQLAIDYAPQTPYTPTLAEGIEPNVKSAIIAAQNFAKWCADTFRPLNVLVEGRGYGATTPGAAMDLRNIQNSGALVMADKVSLVIGQDWTYAETQDAIGKKMADVGTALGSVAKQPTNYHIGEVNTMNLQNAVKGKWLVAGLSNHITIANQEGDLDALDTKGYIFGVNYTGLSGFFWNSDATCTPIIQDSDGTINEYSISLGRTVDKAIRSLRTAFLSVVKSTIPIDPVTGKLSTGNVKYFDGIGNNVLRKMKEISSGDTHTDPESNLITPPQELNVSFTIVPTGQVGTVKGTLNLKKSV